MSRFTKLVLRLKILRSWLLSRIRPDTSSARPTCTDAGAPPMRTVEPVTLPPAAYGGTQLSFSQHGITRYASLYLPPQAQALGNQSGATQWPLLIYLHGSLTTPDSLHSFGRSLLQLQPSYPLSSQPDVRGFLLLAPEGRRADPWPSNGPHTGVGFHWDEWYRSPTDNLDALAIDHFIDEVVATGRVDPSRIYVFGWSNGAYMATLYGVWRSERIAAIAQYAGADPWSRTPCPIPITYRRQVPLVLLRNLCDALVPCATTSAWITTLTEQGWPFTAYSLDLHGNITTASSPCESHCNRIKGLYAHCRWPRKPALEAMLHSLKQHTLP